MEIKRQIARALSEVLREARLLIDSASASGQTILIADLESAVRRLDLLCGQMLSKSKEPPSEHVVGGRDVRIGRKDLEEGGRYRLHASPGTGFDFSYVGPAYEDAPSGVEPPSIWIERDGARQKWFCADMGLEPYGKGGQNQWMHPQCWVSSTEVTDDAVLADAMEKAAKFDVSMLFDDDDDVL